MYIHLYIDLYLSISDDEIIAKHAQLVKKKKKRLPRDKEHLRKEN